MRKVVNKKEIVKYRNLTQKAFEIVKSSTFKGKEKEAGKIFEMVDCYLSDSKHFEKNGDFVNAFGAIYYAHGWIDCGVRLKIFDVKDDQLFTI